MKLTNKQYDVAKQVIAVWSPATITLITGLGSLYRVDVTAVAGTLALVTTFAGTVLGISSRNYQEEQKNGKSK